jgi:hypothetical protein
MNLLQQRKDDEAANRARWAAADAAEEEERRQRTRDAKKSSKKKKSKKEKKSKKKKHRRQSSSSSSGSDSGAEGAEAESLASGNGREALLAAAMELERAKVEDLKRREAERKAGKEAKRRKKELLADGTSEKAEASDDRARLAAWQAAEEKKEWAERSKSIMEAPPDPAPLRTAASQPAKGAEDGDGEDRAAGLEGRSCIPLSFFTRDRLVAWEYPAAKGHGTCFAPLIGVAAGDMSEDEW